MKDHGQNEFLTEGLSEWDPSLDRRQFLKLSGAAIAMAGLSACIKPPLEKMFAYVSQPEDLVLGEPTYFATHFVLGGLANGLLVETHEGRPTRIDGNPEHPASLGASSAIHQALALSLYSDDRVKHKTVDLMSLHSRLESSRATHGQGLAILSEPISSEVLRAQQNEIKKLYPEALWIEYDPLHFQNESQASEKVFGKNLSQVFNFKDAKCVVSIDSDFLSHPRMPLVYAKDFAANEHVNLIAIESSGSLTGQKANKRIVLKPSDLLNTVHNLAAYLLGKASDPSSDAFSAIAQTIKAHVGQTLFLAGDHLPQAVHEACFYLNSQFGNEVVKYRSVPQTQKTEGIEGLSHLVGLMSAKKIQTLFILGGDPAYTAPGTLDFAQALKNVESSTHLSVDLNLTSSLVTGVIPKSHTLETWNDARAFDGTLSFAQPMILPMYDGVSEIEFLHTLITGETKSGRELIRVQFQKKWGVQFDQNWKHTLARGFFDSSKETLISAHPKIAFQVSSPIKVSSEHAFEVSIREDRKLFDGRFVNHPWLQELPDPLTRMTWGNAVFMNPADLKARALKDGDVVKLETAQKIIEGPVFTDPLQALGSATLHLGYGQKTSSISSERIGFNAYPLWNGKDSYQTVSLTKTNRVEALACTQTHHSMEGRDLIRSVSQNEKATRIEEAVSLYNADPIPDVKEAWAMVIDLDRCSGCGACVIACQSENNIPTVGKEAVRLGREMHWIRIDRYFTGTDTPKAEFQPVPCMHCEKAPCEPVCPTGATIHGSGGLNQMVYNRCVGTRYCSNNCPYKVRRFNFLTYTDKNNHALAEQKNPNVSVRTRGIMEKCTYCTQRISAARIKASRENRDIRDGDVKTACQVSCPSQAIVFGNLRDGKSKVSLLKKNLRNYGLLEELGTRPRTTYLAKLKRTDS